MTTQTAIAADFETAYSIAHAACEEARRLASYAAARGDVAMTEDVINIMYDGIMASLGFPDPDDAPASTTPPRPRGHLRLAYSRP